MHPGLQSLSHHPSSNEESGLCPLYKWGSEDPFESWRCPLLAVLISDCMNCFPSLSLNFIPPEIGAEIIFCVLKIRGGRRFKSAL